MRWFQAGAFAPEGRGAPSGEARHGLGMAPAGDTLRLATRSPSQATRSVAPVHRRARSATADRGGVRSRDGEPLHRDRRPSADRGSTPPGPRHSRGPGVGYGGECGAGAALADDQRATLLGAGARMVAGRASAQLRLEPARAGAAVWPKRHLDLPDSWPGPRASAFDPGVDPSW